nr:hypothetical protein [Tanacetum cinerariifolium]
MVVDSVVVVVVVVSGVEMVMDSVVVVVSGVEMVMDSVVVVVSGVNLGKIHSDVIFLWKEKRVRLLVGYPGASTTLIYSPGSSSTPINSLGSSTPPRYSLRASTPQSYSPRTAKNAECSNCKHLLGKITVLEATVKMYTHLEQHTVNSAALFHEVYNNMRKLGLE